jgi:hypothetical protein
VARLRKQQEEVVHGFEQRGPLLRVFQQILRRNPLPSE